MQTKETVKTTSTANLSEILAGVKTDSVLGNNVLSISVRDQAQAAAAAAASLGLHKPSGASSLLQQQAQHVKQLSTPTPMVSALQQTMSGTPTSRLMPGIGSKHPLHGRSLTPSAEMLLRSATPTQLAALEHLKSGRRDSAPGDVFSAPPSVASMTSMPIDLSGVGAGSLLSSGGPQLQTPRGGST